ncbi:MAG: c-type cytochrome, partial [Verrucomicrobia bacterium]|nr:c-type cytochrome [Verrucomicrobiota bacterium]
RLYLASALQRLKPEQRWSIAQALSTHGEDAKDANLPVMIWYGIESLVEADLKRFTQLISSARIPLIRRHIARRVASLPQLEKFTSGVTLLISVMNSTTDEETHINVLTGINEGFTGRPSVPQPDGWKSTYQKLSSSTNSQVREQATMLALTFGDPNALADLRKLAGDTKADAETRIRTIGVLIDSKDKKLDDLLIKLIADTATQGAALRGLASYRHPETVSAILAAYSNFDSASKQDAVQTLCSRPEWASSLLDQIQKQNIPKTDVSAFTLRQLAAFKKPEIDSRIEKIWGKVRPTTKDKNKLIAKFRKQFTPAALEKADPANGRLIFQRTCMACHTLFGKGLQIGPDLTGSDRRNLDYVLENVLDPNAFVANDYQITTLETKDGRIITGMIKSETPNALTVQVLNQEVIVPLPEIKTRTLSPLSMMPDGLAATMTTEQFLDLIKYLSSDQQIPLK